MLDGPAGDVVRHSAESARRFGLPFELLDADELRRRFPMFRVPDDQRALYEPRAGVLFPEDCVAAHLDAARALGADLRFETPVSGWRETGDGLELSTRDRRWPGERLGVPAGAWAGKLLAELALPLVPERNVVHWFDAVGEPEQLQPGRFPIFIWDAEERIYGLPDVRGDGVKVAFHHTGEVVDPD